MKKLLLVSIVLLVAGMGLTLYADPVLTTSGSPAISSVVSIQSLTSGSGGITPPSGSNCTTQSNGGVQCGSGSIVPVSGGPSGAAETETVAGIIVFGLGVLLSIVVGISKPPSPDAPKVVT